MFVALHMFGGLHFLFFSLVMPTLSRLIPLLHLFLFIDFGLAVVIDFCEYPPDTLRTALLGNVQAATRAHYLQLIINRKCGLHLKKVSGCDSCESCRKPITTNIFVMMRGAAA